MPRGVKTFKNILAHWNYDRDPLQSLRYAKAFQEVKAEIQSKGDGWLIELLTRRVFDSKHTTYLDLHPDQDYARQWEQV